MKHQVYSVMRKFAPTQSTGFKPSSPKDQQDLAQSFYARVLVNKMTEELVQGNWPPIVSKEDFIKVQQILEGNHSGYQHNKDEESCPLTRLLKCYVCKGYIPETNAHLVKVQLTKLYNHFNENDGGKDDKLKAQLSCLEKKLKDLKIRHGLGDIDKETYDLTHEHLTVQIQGVGKELNI